MTYFTDKAFPSTFLHRSKGLQEMIVKKEDESPSPSFDFDLRNKYQDERGQRYSATKREERTNYYYDDYKSSPSKPTIPTPRLPSRPSSSSKISCGVLPTEKPTAAPLDSGRSDTGGVRRSPRGVTRSHYQPSESRESYGTILIRAATGTDKMSSLPVSMTVTGISGEDTKKTGRVRDAVPTIRKSQDKVEYHSDKYFTNYFLDSNPKLEEMLTKVEK